MSDRLAFRPLASLETTLEQSISERARTLHQAAKAKTARGSGHDLDKSIAGNSTAIASGRSKPGRTVDAYSDQLEVST